MMELAPSRLHPICTAEAFTMRTFTPPADIRFYAGVDLHARALFVVILDRDGKTVFAKNLPANPPRLPPRRRPPPRRPARRLRVPALLVLARRYLPRPAHRLRPRSCLGH